VRDALGAELRNLIGEWMSQRESEVYIPHSADGTERPFRPAMASCYGRVTEERWAGRRAGQTGGRGEGRRAVYSAGVRFPSGPSRSKAHAPQRTRANPRASTPHPRNARNCCSTKAGARARRTRRRRAALPGDPAPGRGGSSRCHPAERNRRTVRRDASAVPAPIGPRAARPRICRETHGATLCYAGRPLPTAHRCSQMALTADGSRPPLTIFGRQQPPVPLRTRPRASAGRAVSAKRATAAPRSAPAWRRS
jgi:hypothetical protein